MPTGSSTSFFGRFLKKIDVFSFFSERHDHERWYLQMDNATSYNEWLEAARALDEIEGHDRWKAEDESELYDSKLIRDRLQDMRRLEASKDIQGIMFNLRSGLVRGLGGVGNQALHTHCYVGTKRLIEEHTGQTLRLLKMVHDAPEEQLPLEKKLAFFAESRHALGKTALLLSGGASLGMYHFGVLKALHEHNLLPRIISGSSAGSIVAALVGVRTVEEMSELFVPGSIDLTFFPPAGSFRRKLKRLLLEGHLMEVKVLQRALRINLGDVTFYEAYERTGRIVNITVSPANDYERPRLLNYLTSPNVLIWSAACASCAFPILFQPVELVAKNEAGEMVPYHLTDVKWKDGSLQTDLPIARLSELFNVNHFIVSQTNPHAIPFMCKPARIRKSSEHRARHRPSILSRGWNVMRYLVTSELAHRFKQAVTMGLVPKLLEATLFQRLSGDITIVPPFKACMYTNIISNPTWDTIKQFMIDALRATWPSISIIRNHCEVEIMLDSCARSLAKEAQRRAAIACDPSEELDGMAGLYGDAALFGDAICHEDTPRVTSRSSSLAGSYQGTVEGAPWLSEHEFLTSQLGVMDMLDDQLEAAAMESNPSSESSSQSQETLRRRHEKHPR
uniref:PNPLA domain-containing protein n=2 Tax=Guillardia theta TaxID=55529 RepID=A0A7S4KKZ0_GUITH|mmetsp:Transcript_26631/g.87389  ORF Transcript_26631/g.87389 Transcript_26631/m.87389 type:complete len:620 (+) Transcript_26631:129-1988(+)